MNDLSDLIVAVTKVEGAVNGLQVAFEKKTITDAIRFEKIESTIEKQAAVLAAHADLHTSHARLITKANELAIAAAEKVESVRTEAQSKLKAALDTHATETSAKLDGLAVAGVERTKLLDKIIAWQKSPWFKAAWFIGGIIGGAVATYLAAHH